MVRLGVSIGDVIALCILAKDVFLALKDSAGSSQEYISTITGLRGLELALRHVQRCLEELTDETQKAALQQLVEECKAIIDEFLCKLDKYHGHLSSTGTRSGFKDAVRRVEWRLCKTDDLKSFSARIDQHLQSIQIVLVSYKLRSPALEEQLANVNQTLLAHENILNLVHQSTGKLKESFDTLVGIAFTVFRLCQNTTESIMTIKQLLWLQNKQIEQIAQICQQQSSLPPQVLFSPPVILIDAFDQPLPFHLETVNSKEVLMAILRERYRDAGLQKLTSGEFAIEDTVVPQDVDLGRPWHLCFKAGDQKVMSFVFPADGLQESASCPWCQRDSIGDSSQWIKCHHCKRSFRRIEEIPSESLGIAEEKPTADNSDTPEGEAAKSELLQTGNVQQPVRDESSRQDVLQDFWRVRLERRNYLVCLFNQLLDCHVSCSDVEQLHQHVLSHFGDYVDVLPLRVKCFYCDIKFGSKDKRPRLSPAQAWKDMLSHVATQHYSFDQQQPKTGQAVEYRWVRWMNKKKLVTNHQLIKHKDSNFSSGGKKEVSNSDPHGESELFTPNVKPIPSGNEGRVPFDEIPLPRHTMEDQPLSRGLPKLQDSKSQHGDDQGVIKNSRRPFIIDFESSPPHKGEGQKQKRRGRDSAVSDKEDVHGISDDSSQTFYTAESEQSDSLPRRGTLHRRHTEHELPFREHYQGLQRDESIMNLERFISSPRQKQIGYGDPYLSVRRPPNFPRSPSPRRVYDRELLRPHLRCEEDQISERYVDEYFRQNRLTQYQLEADARERGVERYERTSRRISQASRFYRVAQLTA